MITPFVSGHITFGCIDQKFAFQKFCDFHNGVIVFSERFPEFAWIDRYTGIYVIMKGEYMALVAEIPHEGIEIICLLGEFDIQIIGKDIGYFVEAFQATIIVYDGFGTAEIGA
jgi:hypothetical protein